MALVVLSLRVCSTDVMNSFPTQKEEKKGGRSILLI